MIAGFWRESSVLMISDSRPDFYLASAEGYGLAEPRRGYALKRLRGTHRDNFMLIRIEPPILGQKYGVRGDIDQLIVAPRYKSTTLFPIAEWPVVVHVARPLATDLAERTHVDEADMEEIAWAELYPDGQSARDKSM